MKRYKVCVLSIFVVACATVVAQSDLPKQPTRLSRSSGSAYMETRLKQLKAEHEATIHELKAIQELIKADKGDEAITKLATMIEAREAVFKEQSKTMERQLNYLKRIEASRKASIRGDSIPTGMRAPMFKGESFTGQVVDLTEYRGKTIVLEWIDFTCPFSHYHYKVKKTMVGLAEQYKGQDVVWLAINSNSTVTKQDYEHFLKGLGLKELPYPVIDDHEGRIGRQYRAQRTPQIIIIDKTGKIAYNGAIDNAPKGQTAKKDGKKINYVDRALTEILAGRRVSTLETEPYGCLIKYDETNAPRGMN